MAKDLSITDVRNIVSQSVNDLRTKDFTKMKLGELYENYSRLDEISKSAEPILKAMRAVVLGQVKSKGVKDVSGKLLLETELGFFEMTERANISIDFDEAKKLIKLNPKFFDAKELFIEKLDEKQFKKCLEDYIKSLPDEKVVIKVTTNVFADGEPTPILKCKNK
jgi:hypothetical protein